MQKNYPLPASGTEDSIKFHKERRDYYLTKFNRLPADCVSRRALAQRLCQFHSVMVMQLQVQKSNALLDELEK